VESYSLYSLIVPFAESHIQFHFAVSLYSFAPEANKRVLGLLQMLLTEPHFDEALPGQDVC